MSRVSIARITVFSNRASGDSILSTALLRLYVPPSLDIPDLGRLFADALETAAVRVRRALCQRSRAWHKLSNLLAVMQLRGAPGWEIVHTPPERLESVRTVLPRSLLALFRRRNHQFRRAGVRDR